MFIRSDLRSRKHLSGRSRPFSPSSPRNLRGVSVYEFYVLFVVKSLLRLNPIQQRQLTSVAPVIAAPTLKPGSVYFSSTVLLPAGTSIDWNATFARRISAAFPFTVACHPGYHVWEITNRVGWVASVS